MTRYEINEDRRQELQGLRAEFTGEQIAKAIYLIFGEPILVDHLSVLAIAMVWGQLKKARKKAA